MPNSRPVDRLSYFSARAASWLTCWRPETNEQRNHTRSPLKKDLSNEERIQFDVQLAGLRKNPTTSLILSIL